MTSKNTPYFSGNELNKLQAYEVVDLLNSKQVSPKELLDLAYERIDQVSSKINATVHTCRKRAYSSIKKIKPQDDTHPGWLAGLPIGIKDLMPVNGVRTTFGSETFADYVPDFSDPLVDLLEAQGAIIVGKTNTPEFGAGGVTFNSVYGSTRNPWNTKLNPGGSSGGAAASLASGEVWLSHGSDHGGSLRTPAAYCGVVGLRPSPGIAGGSSKDFAFMREGVQGPMARSVRDCALFLDAMSDFDYSFPISFPSPKSSYQEAVKNADNNIKIAFNSNLNNISPVESEIKNHLATCMETIAKNVTAVEMVELELANLKTTYLTLRAIMWVCHARRLPKNLKIKYKETLQKNISYGETLTATQIADAELQRSSLYYEMLNLLSRFDVLACPVVGCMPRPISEEWVNEIEGIKLKHYMDWLGFSFLATVTGLPAISLPIGFSSNGLPIGIQLIGGPRGEAKLLACARAIEIIMNGPIKPIDPQ